MPGQNCRAPGTHARLLVDDGAAPTILDDFGALLVVGSLADGETCVPLIVEAQTQGYVVTRERRHSSPNGLAWPGITPDPAIANRYAARQRLSRQSRRWH